MVPFLVLVMPYGARYYSECLIRPFSEARLFLRPLALPFFMSFLSSLPPCGPLRGPSGSALGMASKISFRHFSLHLGPYQTTTLQEIPQTAPIVRPHSWILGLNLTWAQSNLGSQLICIVGLNFLLLVILGRDSMRSLFSLSPPDFFPSLKFFPFSHIYSRLVVGWLWLHCQLVQWEVQCCQW